MRVIALFGPTAVGKTAVAIAIADELRARGENPVAVSADALQVYEGLQILTGAASPEERTRLEHRLIDFVPLADTFSAGRYAQLAHGEIDTLLAEGRRPVVVGGTGLYLRAALAELDLRPEPPPELRARLQAHLTADGPRALHAELERVAPWAAARVDPGDGQRLVRMLELHEIGALQPREGPSELWTTQMRHPTALVGLTLDRGALNLAIDARVDAIVAAGAAREVAAAQTAGASPTARAALGFSELLAGEVDELKQHTRAYSRRQLTWMRKLPATTIVDVTGREPGDVAREILDSALDEV